MSTYQTIPMKALVPSENNYRRSFDKVAFDELVASVRAKGVIQPIHVRPMDKKKYEIVAGHRRHKAALEAGLKELPAIVLNLTDEEALEIQVIENTQREDPNPMDEAVGFKRLIEMGKHTPETLAEKIGHSTKYVLSRTRLLGLIEEAQELVATGELSLGHALVVSRLKNTDDQKKLLELIRDGDGMTVKEAASRMSSFSSNLADAEFPLAGCASCMARTRNQADLFPALKDAKDECMDRECYLTKTLYHWSEWIEGYAGKGFPVFMDKEDMPAMSYGGRGNGVALIAPSPEGKEWNKTYPPKYATKCVKCKTHHGFYLYVTGDGRYRSLERGEICLSSDCLDEMLKKEAGKGAGKVKENGPEEDSGMGKWQKELLASDCMNRFLRTGIVSKLEDSPEFRQRVLVSQLFVLCKEYGDDEAFLKEFLPDYDEDAPDAPELYEQDEAWRVLRALSPARLDEAIEVLIRFNIPSGHRALLDEMAKDAEVDKADFAIDEEYLKEFSGQDLRELIDELWPDSMPISLAEVDDEDDDEKIRGLILAQDLKGRFPKELVEAEEEENEEKAEGEGTGEHMEASETDGEVTGDGSGEALPPITPEADPTMPQTTQTGRKKRTKAKA